MDKHSKSLCRCISLLHLHGSGLVIAYEGGPPLDGDWLGQRHGPVRLVSGKVLQAAGVRLFLSVLNEQRGGHRGHTRSYLQIRNKVEVLGCESTCRATSADAGLKPKPVGAFSSSSTPLTPGLK